MDAPRLEVRALSKAFPGTRALDGVSASFPGGRVSALVGKNGAGKSTLVKILSGALRPDAGEVLLDGRPARFASPREARERGIATVHQELSLVPELSVAENILLGRLPRRRLLRAAIDWPQTRLRAGEILAALGIALDPGRRVADLSLAQRQMVEIARAVSFSPAAVLLDEPTAGLARAEVGKLFAVVRALAASGVAIVYVTHRLAELREIADTVTALRDGRLAGTVRAAEADPGTLAALMFGERAAGGRAADRTAPAIRAEAAAGPAAPALLEVRGLRVAGLLEDVSFALGRGEIAGIAGLLGSGRTELLHALFGAIRPAAGRVLLEGEDVTGLPPAAMRARGVGLVPEDRKTQGIFAALSVLDNACAAALGRIARRGVLWRGLERRAFDPLARDLEIAAPDAGAPVTALSGGNQQKVVLGRWIACAPRLLLLDEPTRGVDVRARESLFGILRGLRARGVSAVLVSSELEELLEVCDRVLVLRGGRIAEEVRPAGLGLDRLLRLCMEGAA